MSINGKESAEITYKIDEHIGIIKEYPTGWRKELNRVTWNRGASKYDIRDWAEDHSHMSRGITLHDDEMKAIFRMLEPRIGAAENASGAAADEAGAEGGGKAAEGAGRS